MHILRHGICDASASVGLIRAPCLYSKKCNSTRLEYFKNAQSMTLLLGLNVSTCECNDGIYHNILFSYGTLLTSSLDVYHIIYTQPIRASMDSQVARILLGPFPCPASIFWELLMLDTLRSSSRHDNIRLNIMIVFLYDRHSIMINIMIGFLLDHGNIMITIMIVFLPRNVQVHTIVKDEWSVERSGE